MCEQKSIKYIFKSKSLNNFEPWNKILCFSSKITWNKNTNVYILLKPRPKGH